MSSTATSEQSIDAPLAGYTIQGDIGKGAFGSVVLAIRNSDGATIAIKIIALKSSDEKYIAQARNEYELMRRAELSCVPTVHDISYDRNNAYIIMDFINGYNLRKFADNNSSINWDKLELYFKDTSICLLQIHAKNILHRDIKLDNVLLINDVAKIIDFGVSCLTTDIPRMQTLSGTPRYLSDVFFEVNLSLKNFPEKDLAAVWIYQDIWALCVTFYWMWTRRWPYDAKTTRALKGVVLGGDARSIDNTSKSDVTSFIMSVLTRKMTISNISEELAHLTKKVSK